MNIFGNINSIWEFINEIWNMGLKINIDLFLKNGECISYKDIFGK